MRTISLFLSVLLFLVTPFAGAVQVDSISINSSWGGLGTPSQSTLLIRREGDHYRADGKALNSALISAFVRAIEEPPLAAPDADNLGLSSQWLREHAAAAGKDATYFNYHDGSPPQQELFRNAFCSQKTLQTRLEAIYDSFHSDDYPHIAVNLKFIDGSSLELRSDSQHPFMIPWEVERPAGSSKTYNAHISEALVALLPAKFTNHQALTAGDPYADGLVAELASNTAIVIEAQWNSIGAQERAGIALAALKGTYQIRRSDVNSYHDLDFGKEWKGGVPHEVNLEVNLWRPGFPPNFIVGAWLLRRNGTVEGADSLAASSKPYEDLVLSIPWLRHFWETHPDEYAKLFYVHGVSLTDKGMSIFAADMTAAGRPELIQKVKAVQSHAALIETSNHGYALEYAQGDYWIVLPDKSVILWRWQSPQHALLWKSESFPAHGCTDYGTVTGGCSGTIISPQGEVISR